MPPRDRLTGVLTGQALQMRASHHRLIVRAMQECGDYARLSLFGAPAIVISCPEGARTVLQSDASKYDKQTMGYRQVARVLGEGLFTSDGDHWRDNRVVLQPFFTRKTLAHYGTKMRRHALDLCETLPPGPVDMEAQMVALTLRILGDCIFDEDFEPYVPLMLEEFLTILAIVNDRVINHVPLMSLLKPQEERTFQASLARFEQAVSELIDKALANPHRAESQTSMIHALAAQDAARDRKNIRDQVITMMFAGHETSAVAMQWILYALSQNPDWRQRIEAEVDAAAEGDELPILGRFIEETLRLYPPVWIVSRRIEQDVVIGGYEVARGTMILVVPFNIHRNPQYWEEPTRFDPDRFLPERVSTHEKGQYIPFGMGKRACVGKHMALLELTTITAALVRRFRFDPAPGFTAEIGSSLTLRPEGGMPMIGTRRPTAQEAP